MRSGIPYGPEVSDAERQTQKTSQDRGLLFVSYQSVLGFFGFNFIQKIWANDIIFPPPEDNSFEVGVPAGFDPIIGNAKGEARARESTGTDATFMKEKLVMKEDFVVAEGGEYFFIPSLKAIDRISNGEGLPSVEPFTAAGGLLHRLLTCKRR
ncbi:hypothetical protein FS837_006298 [Tulasnella sp. UAMH 9824]|nr:hypothetical protein FS837_006298 [Tulasnella sp. UAMH 9824]